MGNHRFGTTMIEAHVTTTIRENYFRWMFQILADPKCMPEPDMAANFKTEYDLQEQGRRLSRKPSVLFGSFGQTPQDLPDQILYCRNGRSAGRTRTRGNHGELHYIN
jgi:hypothetical protein